MIGLAVLYLMSDLSHVKSLTVNGNFVYSDAMILKKAGLDYDSSFILTNRFWIARQLEKDELIEECKVIKNMQGGIEIQIKEKKIIGYLKEDEKSLLVQGTGLISMNQMDDKLIHNIPRLSDLNPAQLKELDEAFANVEDEYVYMISEIIPFQTSYDANMVQLIMMDGNRINTSYRGIQLINNYKEILQQLEGTHVCLYVDEFSGNIIKENGSCSPYAEAENTENAENDKNVSENPAE